MVRVCVGGLFSRSLERASQKEVGLDECGATMARIRSTHAELETRSIAGRPSGNRGAVSVRVVDGARSSALSGLAIFEREISRRVSYNTQLFFRGCEDQAGKVDEDVFGGEFCKLLVLVPDLRLLCLVCSRVKKYGFRLCRLSNRSFFVSEPKTLCSS